MGLLDKLFGRKEQTPAKKKDKGLRAMFAEAEPRKSETAKEAYELVHPGLMLTVGVAELLFRSFPGKLDAESLKRHLPTDRGQITVDAGPEGILVVTFKDISLSIKGNEHPAQVLVESAPFTPSFDGMGDPEDQVIIDGSAVDPLALLMRDAVEELPSCRHGIRIFEKGAGLPGPLRVELLARVTRAACAALNPPFLYWRSAFRLLDVPEFLRVTQPFNLEELATSITTVRMGKVQGGEDDEYVADTVGLFPFGLPDVQMHYRKLPPDVAGAFLMSTAHKLWTKGLFAYDGDTLGVEAKRPGLPELTLNYEQPKLAPAERVMLALDAGGEFAAPKREAKAG